MRSHSLDSTRYNKSFVTTATTKGKKQADDDTRLLRQGSSTSSSSDTNGSEGANPLLVRRNQAPAERASQQAPKAPFSLKKEPLVSPRKAAHKKIPAVPSPATRKAGMPPMAEKLFGCLDVDAERAAELCVSAPKLLPALEAVQVVGMNKSGDGYELSMDYGAALLVLEALVEPAPDLACKLFLLLSPSCRCNIAFMKMGPRLRAVQDSIHQWAAHDAQPPVDIAPIREALFQQIADGLKDANRYKDLASLSGWMDACPAWALDEVLTMITKGHAERIEDWCVADTEFARAWKDLNARHARFKDRAVFKVTDLNTIADEVQPIVDALGIPEQEAVQALEEDGGLCKLIAAIQLCPSWYVTNSGQLAMVGDDAWAVISSAAGDAAWQARFIAALHPDSLLALADSMGPHRFSRSVSSWLHRHMSPNCLDGLRALRKSYLQAFGVAVKNARQATGWLASKKHRTESMHALATLLEAAPDWLVFDLVADLKAHEKEESRFMSLFWQTEEFSTAWMKARERAVTYGRHVLG